jgi:hypothetical protein
MWHRYSNDLREAILRAYRIAQSEGMVHLSTRHLLMGLTTAGVTAAIIQRLGGKDSLVGAVPPLLESVPDREVLPGLTPAARVAVDLSYREAAYLGDQYLETEHLLLALLRVPDSEAGSLLKQEGITRENVARELMELHTWRTIAPEGTEVPMGWQLSGRNLYQAVRKRLQVLRRILLALTQLSADPVVASIVFTQQRLTYPHRFFRRLRERGLYFSRAADGWVVSSHEDVQTALREPLLSARRFDLAFLEETAPLPPVIDREFNVLCSGLSQQMLFQDAPDQTRARSLVSRQFTPRVLTAIRTQIQTIADQLLDKVVQRDEMDLIADFAFPLPATVIARLLGVNDGDLIQFKSWSDAFVHFIGGQNSLEEDLRAYDSLRALNGYFHQVVASVRQSPDDTNLLSLLANAVDEQGTRLTDEEVTMNGMLLLAAGHETTTHLIGNGLLLLFQHPQVMRELQEDPTLMPGAVEEMLRYEGPVQWTNRIALSHFSFKGVNIKRGQAVNIALAAANRDPARFSDPDVFDIRRKDNRHVAFGSGPHFCLGAALARMEAEIALNTLLRRFPGIRRADAKADWRRDFTFRAQRKLRVYLR